MTFREFVIAICFVNKARFSAKAAKTLLVEATTNDNFNDVLSDISDSTFRSYIRDGRNISESFDDEVIAYLNEENLKEYFMDICEEEESAQRFCEAFREYCPEITEENSADLAVKLFKEMLDSAGGEENQASPHKKKRKSSKNDLKDMQSIITQLHCTVEKLIENSIRIRMHQNFDTEADSDYQNEFNQNHEAFLNLNMELHNYVVIYPGLAIIDTLFELSRTIDFTFKTVLKEDRCYIESNDKIDEYKQCLDQLLKTLHEK